MCISSKKIIFESKVIAIVNKLNDLGLLRWHQYNTQAIYTYTSYGKLQDFKRYDWRSPGLVETTNSKDDVVHWNSYEDVYQQLFKQFIPHQMIHVDMARTLISIRVPSCMFSLKNIFPTMISQVVSKVVSDIHSSIVLVHF